MHARTYMHTHLHTNTHTGTHMHSHARTRTNTCSLKSLAEGASFASPGKGRARRCHSAGEPFTVTEEIVRPAEGVSVGAEGLSLTAVLCNT